MTHDDLWRGKCFTGEAERLGVPSKRGQGSAWVPGDRAGHQAGERQGQGRAPSPLLAGLQLPGSCAHCPLRRGDGLKHPGVPRLCGCRGERAEMGCKGRCPLTAALSTKSLDGEKPVTPDQTLSREF